MKNKICFIIPLILLFISGFNSMDFSTAPAQEDVVIVACKGKPRLTPVQLKRIFLGKIMKWPDGDDIKVLLNKDKDITKIFCEKYLKISSFRLRKKWVTLGIRKGIPMPRSVSSNVVMAMVKHSTKFIGYIEKSQVTPDVTTY